MTYLPNGAIVLPSGEGRLIPGPPDLVVKVGADEASGSVAVMEGTLDPGFGPEKQFDELAKLAQEIGEEPSPDDPRFQTIMARYETEYVGPPLK